MRENDTVKKINLVLYNYKYISCFNMAYRCPVTKKGTHFGNNRSHALNSTRRR